MKTKVLIMVILTFAMSGCEKFDDSHLWDSINSLNNRVERLEDICDRMNTNISSLQAIVQALENNDAVTSVSSLPDASGYTITFASGKVITIYNGTDGKDGEDGKNGIDGQDGKTPIISIRQDVDGVYYWTVDGEWLIVDGQKVKAVGTDGKDGIDGNDGNDGMTPQFKIENGHWYISYDNGMSWIQLGKATGDNGLNGADGESLFKGVSIENGYVYFILNDIESTVIKIRYSSDMSLAITVEAGTLDKVLTREQQLSLTTLILKGTINEDDMKFLNSHMTVLENLNMENANYISSQYFDINPYEEFLSNRTLRTIVLPKGEYYYCNFDYCACLEKLVITSDSVWIDTSSFLNDSPRLSSIDSLIVAEGVTTIKEKTAYYFNTVILPSSLISVDCGAFAYGSQPQIKTIISKASQPPYPVLNTGKSTTSFYDGYNRISHMNLYVPASSVELYKKAPGWSQFKNILPIEE